MVIPASALPAVFIAERRPPIPNAELATRIAQSDKALTVVAFGRVEVTVPRHEDKIAFFRDNRCSACLPNSGTGTVRRCVPFVRDLPRLHVDSRNKSMGTSICLLHGSEGHKYGVAETGQTATLLALDIPGLG
jgi:hypothetical protein